jgi:hypothetical protein
MKTLSLFMFKLTLLLCLFFLGFIGLIVNIGYIFVETFDKGIISIYSKVEDKLEKLNIL